MHTPENGNEPIWARPDAFPRSPAGQGWMDPGGKLHPVDDRDSLLREIADDKSGRVMLVWTQGRSHLVLPEELEEAEHSVRKGRQVRYESALKQAKVWLIVGSTLLFGVAYQQAYVLWPALPPTAGLIDKFIGLARLLLVSLPLCVAALLWFALIFMPWYQARKDMREWGTLLSGDSTPLIPTLRLDTWLMIQRAPLTRVIAGGLLVIWLVQYVASGNAIAAAGLVKPAYHQGEYWRLLTAPWVHGNLVHFLFNFLALLYLGKRVEVFARWPHLLLVLLFSMLAGGILSARYLGAASVGISGGLMGWLGFLLIFESLHRRLGTRSARRRLLAGLLLTLVMGIIGYRFIDNAAHLGGLLAGMLYGVIVFPVSESIHRPRILWIDCVAAIAAGVVLAGGFVLTLVKLSGMAP